MAIQSLNPANEEVIASYDELSDEAIQNKIATAEARFQAWRQVPVKERAALMYKLAEVIRKNKERYGRIITLEMGKPIKQAIGEAAKCAWCCDYYAEHAEEFLAPEMVETDAQESYVLFEPLGVVLAVMPWNFPLWQVIRFIAPAAIAGNVGLLKHASSVPQCALILEEMFLEAGFPEGVFQTLLIGSRKVKQVLDDDRVKAVTLTGSEFAGSKVAEQAGKLLKKSVMELGGSNPYVVLKDADMDLAVEKCILGRYQNTGQSCIAAKRFIVEKSIAKEFTEKLKTRIEAMKVGDPLEEDTDIGPLYGQGGLDDTVRQVEESLKKGANLVTGGKRIGDKGFFYAPTLLDGVEKGMPVLDEETFGPVGVIIEAEDIDDAIAKANDTVFGLGSAVFTQSDELANYCIQRLNDSSVFVNEIVKSDPRLPFGGIKISGYGRELSKYGMREFQNIKTIYKDKVK